MYEGGFLILGVLWLGILTSISPCPLATNIAAISFISKKIDNRRKVILSGVLYTLGRSFIYIGLTIIISFSLMSIPEVSNFLQSFINKILGIILIITGMFLLEILTISFRGNKLNSYAQRIADQYGDISSFLIGALFALAFCPISAALFFGTFIPLTLKNNASELYALLYGIGTAIPIVIFSILIAIGSQSLSKVFNKITIVELWTRKITGIIFIFVGVYYTLIYIW